MMKFSPKIQSILDKKSKHERISMLTAYDYPMAALIDAAGIDMILVGDSLANVVLGLESTRQVGMPEILHHTKAVVRAVKKASVIGDMPFDAYQQVSLVSAVENARQLIAIGCDAVKLEWFEGCLALVSALVASDIPVMGHLGLTPQTAVAMKVQGKDAASALAIFENAKRLEDAGACAVVLECIPLELAQKITAQLTVPTIGIGAGPHCDGQVLVLHDLLGLSGRRAPKFSKKYLDLSAQVLAAVKQYKTEVTSGQFPDDAHSFHL